MWPSSTSPHSRLPTFTFSVIALSASADYSCALLFKWFDPNSVRENSITAGTCHSFWSWDSATILNSSNDGTSHAVGYRLCWLDQDTSFKLAVPSFWHPGSFSLELVHRYRDDENLTRPWDHPTTFAQAEVRIGAEQKRGNYIHHYTRGPVNGTVVGIAD
ncbi:hypothetical protein BT67DRAFT_438425 [Trichocladium antarcticum]|uniref:Uncharacterized protein n=1 Tax=Trichocladium antarcticum TaxID=1450529 RepID=A0AAN6UQU4_9PEZI|nr:hypothetical protein BT67DRAFT_438425 [Trichocladium antarcticum]